MHNSLYQNVSIFPVFPLSCSQEESKHFVVRVLTHFCLEVVKRYTRKIGSFLKHFKIRPTIRV